MLTRHQTTKTLKILTDEKMKVLREFYIVSDENEKEIRSYLERALRNNPDRDPQIVLDQAAIPLIKEKFRDD